MGAICGILGKADAQALAAMVAALKHRADLAHRVEGRDFCLAASAPVEGAASVLDGAPESPDGACLSAAQAVARCKAIERNPGTLRGAYAAVVACSRKKWLLVRDRLGRCPLYYFQGNGFLLFASELKALMATGLVPKRLNLRSVDRYLTLRCVPGEESVVQGVDRVPPGHAVRYDGERVTTSRIDDFVMSSDQVPREEAAADLRDRLRDAVQRADADRVLWSAGVDCAALAAVQPELKPLFALLPRAWQNEGRLARESARKMGLDLAVEHSNHMTDEAFRRAVYALDEPIADASVLPTWLVFEAASRHTDTAVSGHGADALLGGFPRFHFLQKAHGNARTWVPVGLVGGIMPALPPNAFVRRWSRYLASIHDNLGAYLSLVSVFDQEERQELYTDAMKAALADNGGPMAAFGGHFEHVDLTRNLLSLDLHVGLPDLELAKCDRLAAAHGLQVRTPYLDDALIDCVARLAPATKFGVRAKPLLRMAMRGVLPGRLRLRARRDFRIPDSGREVRVIESMARQLITPERVNATGIFKWQHIRRVVNAASHNVYRRRQYWAILMFFAWYEQMMET
ncbi:MAG: hypothetical protein GY851_07025 [bacterium]|nr:hypothetical protein [bacterium]